MVMLMSCYITYQLTFRANWTIPARATRRTLIKLNMNNVQHMVGMTTEMRYMYEDVVEHDMNYIHISEKRQAKMICKVTHCAGHISYVCLI